ncbi:amidohydrolase [Ramlibacter sp.]|uniref:amidohydrolase n=1 Tax=Ramlibacter sp. TaxID=1917967 RepID=UPI003D14B774
MPKHADLILINGKVLTIDEKLSTAQAVAVSGKHILAVGTNAEISKLADESTRVVDLKGRTAIPGMTDGHAHMDREGLKAVFPSLGKVRSIGDIKKRIAELVKAAKPGEWIVTMPIGDPPTYFNVPEILEEGRFPTRHDLDEVSPDNPVYIRPIWGFWRHTTPLVSIANSRALALAGIDRDTPSPSTEVTIKYDEQGEPTGVFYEETMMPIVEMTLLKAVPGFTPEDRVKTLPTSMAAYHSCGTTSILEEHGVATELLKAYKQAWGRGELTMRTTLVVSPSWQVVPRVDLGFFVQAWCGWLSEPALGDEFLKVSGIFVDMNKTAENEMRAERLPYTGWAGFNYNTALPRERALELLRACAQNDVRVVAIWPNMLDLYYEVHKEFPLNGKRWVLGHISILSARDIEKIAEMDLVLTSHTNRNIYKEGHLHLQRLGAERRHEISPLRSLVEKGVTVSLATDNVPVSLFYPIWEAVARKSRNTGEVIGEGECLTRMQALQCATIHGARLTFDEHRQGSIEPGKLADIVVLDKDPLTCELDDLKDITADMTYVGGQLVYSKLQG